MVSTSSNHRPMGTWWLKIVGSDKDEYGIDRVAMLLQALVGLVGDIVPLATARGIDVWSDAQPLLQQMPVLNL